MIPRPPRSTLDRSSAASDVYKRQAYVTVVVQSRLASFDDSLEEAALDLGARPAKGFFRITVPLILPAILSGWLLAFTLSWDDLVVTQFVSGPGSNTLPMVIFSRVRLGVSPVVNALASIMVLICLLYTSDAADERSSVDLGGRRIIKKKKITLDETE